MKKIIKYLTEWCDRYIEEITAVVMAIAAVVLSLLLVVLLVGGIVTLVDCIVDEPETPETTTVQQAEVTTTKVETTEPEPEEPPVQYYDIPLSKDLQEYIFGLCVNYNIEPELIFAIIKKESNYIASSIGDYGNSYGLMQIQPRWHQARMDSLFCPNLLNPYQNVTVGIDYLGELFDTGNSLEWVLMAYNSGPSTAYKNTASGRVSQYAKTVLKYYKEIKVGV